MKGKAMTMSKMIVWGLGLDRPKAYFTWTGDSEWQKDEFSSTSFTYMRRAQFFFLY